MGSGDIIVSPACTAVFMSVKLKTRVAALKRRQCDRILPPQSVFLTLSFGCDTAFFLDRIASFFSKLTTSHLCVNIIVDNIF
jgi:hypothetical protein